MKKILTFTLLAVTFADYSFAQIKIGTNSIPLISRIITEVAERKGISMEFPFEINTKKQNSNILSLGFTNNSNATLVGCIQCAGNYSKVTDLDAVALKYIFRRYFSEKKSYIGFGTSLGYYKKLYALGFATVPYGENREFYVERTYFAPAFQIGRERKAKKVVYDLGLQLAHPLLRFKNREPAHFFVTSGFLPLNLYFNLMYDFRKNY